MAQETFAFTSSALRSLQLQRELLEQEDRRRALAWESATRRFLLASPRPPLTPRRRPQYCRDPAVHNALYTGDLLRVKSIFKDETTANLVMETVSEELVWSPEQGLWVLSPRRQQTSALRIAAGRGYGDCARHLVLRGAEVDAVVGGRAPPPRQRGRPPPRMHPPAPGLRGRPQRAERRGLGPAAPLHRARQPPVRGAAAGTRGAGEPGDEGPAADGPARGGAAGAGGPRGAVPATRRRSRPSQPPRRDPPQRRLLGRRAPRGRRALLPGGRAVVGGRCRSRCRRPQGSHAVAQRLR
uniref:Ankyrin repeat and SOCS box containing 16 n=1 Tax=Aquila chrysaetos chrysaetos TaxID=223781 RepID=A0A663F3J2_AQUCH